jgi:hypothetical protein
MIEFSLTELLLLGWGVLVTGFLVDAKREAHMAKQFVMHFIENDKAREQMIQDYKQYVARKS